MKIGEITGLRSLVAQVKQDAREAKRARQKRQAMERDAKRLGRIQHRQELTGYVRPLRKLEGAQQEVPKEPWRKKFSKSSRGGKGKKSRTKFDAVICPYKMTRHADPATRAVGAAQARESHEVWGACKNGRWVGNTFYYPAWQVTPKSERG